MITARQAKPEDLKTLLQFEQGIIKTERPFDSTLKDGEIHYYDLEQLILSPLSEVTIVEIDGEIIGSGYAQLKDAENFLNHKQYAHLGFMYVRPEHRGKGINKIIIDALIQWVKTHNVSEVRLNVYDENAAARKAYEKAGFKGLMLKMRMEIEA